MYSLYKNKKEDDCAEAQWQVVANGQFVESGKTIRRNGIWCDVITHENKSSNRRLPADFARKQCPESSSETSIGESSSEHQFEAYESEETSTDSSTCDDRLRRMTVEVVQPRHTRAAVLHSLELLDWNESNGESAVDIWWYGIDGDIAAMYAKRDGVYAINRIPGISDLTQKINFSRIIKRMQKLYPKDFEFYPQTWYFPQEYQQFMGEAMMMLEKSKTRKRKSYDEDSGRETYIFKPSIGSHGEGIYLIHNDLSNLVFTPRPAIVQKYISNPLLIDDYKFDLRMYIVVARLEPTEIYFCKDGLARFCTMKYKRPRLNNLNKSNMHLTNYTLNKNSSTFKQTDDLHTGSKRTYRSIQKTLRAEGYNVEKIHSKIVDLCNKVVLSMVPDLRVYDNFVNSEKHIRPFQILGFDILLTDDLEPILLEINASPSLNLTAERETFFGSGVFECLPSSVDEQIKVPLVRDCLRLIAYGESEMGENCCLERIYPPPICNKSGPNLSSQKKHTTSPQEDSAEQKEVVTKGGVIPTPSSRIPIRVPDFSTHPNYKGGKLNEKMGNVSKYFKKASQNCGKKEKDSKDFGPKQKPVEDPTEKDADFLDEEEEEEKLPPDFCCKVCGNYVNGFGPSLIYAQEDYYNKNPLPSPSCQVKKNSKASTTKVISDISELEADDQGPSTRKTNPNFNVCQICRSNSLSSSYPSGFGFESTPHNTYRTNNRILQLDELTRFLKEESNRAAVQRCTTLNRAAKAFIFFNGIRPSLTISPNAFRNMVRRCHLCDFFYLPTIDIMYIELMRECKEWRYLVRTNEMQAPKVSALPFQGFVDALFRIANTHFDGSNLSFKLDSLLDDMKKCVRKEVEKKAARKKQLKLTPKGNLLPIMPTFYTVPYTRQNESSRF